MHIWSHIQLWHNVEWIVDFLEKLQKLLDAALTQKCPIRVVLIRQAIYLSHKKAP